MLTQARAELDSALATSRTLIDLTDVSGVITSGDALLTAAQATTEAGHHLTSGIGHLSEGIDSPVIAIDRADQELSLAATSLREAEASLGRVRKIILPKELKAATIQLEELIPRILGPLEQYLAHESVVKKLLGTDQQRQYLLLFENNHELRPTGGFIGSIGLVNVDQGKVENVDVQSVYDPDGQLKELIAPPDPLRKIVDRWYLRDANWFVDFEVSAKKIANFFEKEGGPTVDGVIALTPEVIKSLLEVTGPIFVPAHNVTVDAETFAVTTQDLVTYSYDREENDPKKFLRDLAPLLLEKLFAAETGQAWEMINTLSKAATEKHLLIYFKDDVAQSGAVAAGWAGKIPQERDNLVYVNNANIGGHKSDQFMEQEIDYRAQLQDDGSFEAVLTIRRTHLGPSEEISLPYPTGENPAWRDNVVYQRVLLPTNAELIEATGFTAEGKVPRPLDDAPTDAEDYSDFILPDAEVAEWHRAQETHSSGTQVGLEAGYQYFANWQVTSPGATTVGLYRYRLPANELPSLLDPAKNHSVYFVKQPGDTRSTVRAELTLPNNHEIVHTVPNEGTTRQDQRTFTYRGLLKQDKVVGAVFTTL